MLKISKEDWLKLKELYNDGMSITKLAEKFGVSFTTCQHYVKMTESDFKVKAENREAYLDQYREYLVEQLKAYPQIQDTNLYYQLTDKFPDFECKTSTFHWYMKRLREGLGPMYNRERRTSIRKPLEPGYEAQVDFGQYKLLSMYGSYVRVYFFVMTLSYSRMHFVYFSIEPFTTKIAIEAHDYAFRYFGGRTQTIMYDQDRVFVVSENFGKTILVSEFEDYVKKVGYSVVLCRPRDPQTKGKVENLVKYVKGNFLEGRVFAGINELNEAALKWLDTMANASPNETTHRPPKELFEKEAKCLFRVPHLIIDRVELRSVSSDFKVTFENSKYEMPHFSCAPHDQVRIEKKDGKLNFYLLPLGALIYVVDQAPEGSAVPCVDVSAQMQSIAEIELRKRLDGVDVREAFMAELELTVPRFRTSHLRKIKQMVDGYGIERVEDAMEYCLIEKNCTAFEMAAYLIYKYGAGIAKKYLDKNIYYTCKARADGIARERNGRYQ